MTLSMKRPMDVKLLWSWGSWASSKSPGDPCWSWWWVCRGWAWWNQSTSLALRGWGFRLCRCAKGCLNKEHCSKPWLVDDDGGLCYPIYSNAEIGTIGHCFGFVWFQVYLENEDVPEDAVHVRGAQLWPPLQKVDMGQNGGYCATWPLNRENDDR